MASVKHSFSGTLRGLDVRPDRVDFRDRPYRPPLTFLPPQYPPEDLADHFLPRFLEDGYILNQGSEGACTGFGLAAVINYVFWERYLVETERGRAAEKPHLVSERMLYNNAKLYDEWDGEDYSGSSCRGAMKGWHKHGVCKKDLFPYDDNKFVPPKDGWEIDAIERPLGAYYRVDSRSIADMQAAIVETHAIYASAKVHDGWSLKKCASLQKAVIQRTSDKTTGGHAFALVGYNRFGFIVQNSWGPDWGYKGFGLLPYKDWVDNGFDAWVAVVGAPVEVDQVAVVKPSAPLANLPVSEQTSGSSSETGLETVTRWSEAKTYRHSVVSGNDGRLLRRLPEAADAHDGLTVVFKNVRQLLEDNKARKLVFFAHGGLTGEDRAIRHAQKLGPCFEANGIAPVFFVWKTGLAESLKFIGEDHFRRFATDLSEGPGRAGSEGLFDVLKEKRDRTFELAARQLVGRAVWGQMKQNAASAALGEGAIRQVSKHVRTLLNDFPDLELHMVGHSAGSIWLGHFLEDLRQRKLGDKKKPPVRTVTLWAPACTIAFAGRYYGHTTEKHVIADGGLHVDLLNDELERADFVGKEQLYGKSILYLVSRALEDDHKTPLLGLEWALKDRFKEAFEKDIFAGVTRKSAEDWVAQLKRINASFSVLEDRETTNGLAEIPVRHGSFDNDIAINTEMLRRILGAEPKVIIKDLATHSF